MKKPSFFAKLTGAGDDYDDFFDEPKASSLAIDRKAERPTHITPKMSTSSEEAESEEPGGELAVDVYQTNDAIVVKALVAGLQPSSIDIALTREMITISGMRQEEHETEDDNYFQRELYWGSFSRTILLPEEIDVDLAEATEKHGILMIRLPKINKKRQAKLKVRSR